MLYSYFSKSGHIPFLRTIVILNTNLSADHELMSDTLVHR